MKDNQDPHQVVMGREVYDDLMKLATVAENECVVDDVLELARIRWHIRKYNAPLRAQRKIELMEELDRVNRAKEKLFSLLEHYTNKEVWQRHPSSKRYGLPVYFKVTLLGRARDKRRVIVRYENGSTLAIPAEGILTALPEGYKYLTEGIWERMATRHIPEDE